MFFRRRTLACDIGDFMKRNKVGKLKQLHLSQRLNRRSRPADPLPGERQRHRSWQAQFDWKKTWGEFKIWCEQEMIPTCWKEQERRTPFQNAFSAQHGLVLCLDICWWKFAYFLGVLGALSEDGGNSCRCGTEINTCTKSPSRCGVFGNI